MPHDTIIFAILAMLIYIFVPEFFGYAAIALVLRLGFPIMRVVWQTTRDIREIPETEDEEGEEGEDGQEGQDEAEDETEETHAGGEQGEDDAADGNKD